MLSPKIRKILIDQLPDDSPWLISGATSEKRELSQPLPNPVQAASITTCELLSAAMSGPS